MSARDLSSTNEPAVALVISDLTGGGAQRVLTTLTNAWSERGRKVTVITLDDGSSDFFGLETGVKRVALDLLGASQSRFGAVLGNLRRVLALRKAIRESGAEVVISFVGTTNLIAVLACAGLRQRLIVSERNDPARQSLGFPWQRLRRWLYPRADLVTANSHAALATLGGFVPEARLRFVPNPLPKTARTGRTSRSGPEAPTILSAGRLTAQKGFDVLLAAFAASQARSDGWRLAILGEGPLRDALERQAATLGITDQVEWRGLHPDIQSQLAGAEIFALASRHEGTPNVVLDAMSASRSVVVTETCAGALEFITHEVTGLVVPGEDPVALASALDRLVAEPDLRTRLAGAAAERVRAFELDRVLPVWDDLVRQVSPGEAAVSPQVA